MAKADNPLISIIISTKNEVAHLPLLLKSIGKSYVNSIEVLVVDNFSTDRTIDIAKSWGARVYLHGNERSEQRNFGAKKARGTYLLFLDADMQLSKQALKECIDRVKNRKVYSLVIPESAQGDDFFARVKRIEKKLYENEPLIEAARLFRKSVFHKVGGYNTDLIAGEDWDLSQRIKLLGKSERIAACVFHQEKSLLHELQHKWYYANHIGKYARTHPAAFSQQKGIERVKILFKKKGLILGDPLAYAALLFLKALEFLIYMYFLLLSRIKF